MSISSRKITTWTSPVESETDRPTRTAAALKAVFDSNSNQLKTAYNGLIDDLAGTTGAGNIGAKAIEGLTGSSVQDQIEALNTKVFGIIQTDEPANRFLNGAGQYAVPTVGASANGLPLAGDDNDFLLKNGSPDYAAKWSGAASVRTLLNVADGADVTATQIGNAAAAETLADTDHFPVYSGALKKTTWSGLKAAIKAYLDTQMDYVVSNSDVTVDGNTWRVREWRSGRIGATIRIQATNDASIPYIESNGVYRSNPVLLSDGVPFPYTLSNIFLYYSIRGIRTGFNIGSVNYDTGGITGVHVWSPVTAPFTATPSLYLDLMVYVEGIPA